MKRKLMKTLFGNPTAFGVAMCFIATWVTLERIENKIDKISKSARYYGN